MKTLIIVATLMMLGKAAVPAIVSAMDTELDHKAQIEQAISAAK